MCRSSSIEAPHYMILYASFRCIDIEDTKRSCIRKVFLHSPWHMLTKKPWSFWRPSGEYESIPFNGWELVSFTICWERLGFDWMTYDEDSAQLVLPADIHGINIPERFSQRFAGVKGACQSSYAVVEVLRGNNCNSCFCHLMLHDPSICRCFNPQVARQEGIPVDPFVCAAWPWNQVKDDFSWLELEWHFCNTCLIYLVKL